MMGPNVATGLFMPPNPPLTRVWMMTGLARMTGLASLVVWDHFQEFYPRAMWMRDSTWFATRPPVRMNRLTIKPFLVRWQAVRAGCS